MYKLSENNNNIFEEGNEIFLMLCAIALKENNYEK